MILKLGPYRIATFQSKKARSWWFLRTTAKAGPGFEGSTSDLTTLTKATFRPPT